MAKATPDGVLGIVVMLVPELDEAARASAFRDAESEEALKASIAATQDVVLAERHQGRLRVRRRYEVIYGFSAEADIAAILELASLDRVESIHPLRKMTLMDAEALALTQTAAAHARGYDGTGVTIAVIDTAIDHDNPVFGGDHNWPNSKIIGGYDIADGDDDPRLDITNGQVPAQPCDLDSGRHGHGTAVTGVAAGDGAGVTGAAPDARIVFLKVQKREDCRTNQVYPDPGAISWVVAHRAEFGIRVVTMSFGGGAFAGSCSAAFPEFQNAVTTAYNAGLAVFAASGNGGVVNGISFPACLDHVNSVGAVYDANIGPQNFVGLCSDPITAADRVTCYSNSASSLDILAPSHCASTALDNCFGGTSAASPFAAGAAADLLEARPTMLPGDLLGYMRTAGVPVTDWRNGLVVPRVNTLAALDMVTTQVPPDPPPTVPNFPAPSSLSAEAPVDLSPPTSPETDDVVLTWDDNSGDEWGFEIEQRFGGQWELIEQVAAGQQDVVLEVPQPISGSKNIRFRVRAWKNNGADVFSAYSNEASVTVFAEAPGPITTAQPHGCVSSATPAFAWSPAERAYTYYLAVSRVDNGELVINEPSLLGESFVPTEPLLPGVAYQWKVKSCNNAGCGPWSPFDYFTSYCVPTEPPTLLTPQGCVNNTLRPTLSWTSVPGATDYIWSLWRVDPNSPNDDFILYNSWHTLNTSATVPEDLQSGTQYRFRVKTGNGPNYGPFSHHRYFTIGCTAGMKPGTASPLSPWNGELTSALPTLSWEVATLADSYTVEVYTYPASQFVYSVAYAASAVCNAFDCGATPSTPLLPGQGYAWHVRAQNTAGWGPPSPWATFNVPTVDGAAFVSQTVPAAMTTGVGSAVTVRMRNTGTTTWTSAGAYALADPAGSVWGLSTVPIPASVPPGAEVTFAFTATAPATPGTRAFQWRMRHGDGAWFGDASPGVTVTVSHPVGPNESAGHDVFQQSGAGTVWLDAEQFSRNQPRNGYRWELDHTPDNAGLAAMRAAPNTGGGFGKPGYGTTSPQLDFKVNFTKTGTHYVWVRGYAPLPDPPSNDSCHIGLDGAEVATSDRITGFGSGWTWSNATMDSAAATIEVASTGVHTVNLWMREDGFVADRIMLTTDAGLVPTGLGRASARGAVQQDTGPLGLAVFEVERYDTRIARSGYDWVGDFTPGSAGIAGMQAAPNVGGGFGSNWSTLSPQLDVKVNFVQTGTHYVWVRGFAPGPDIINNDSCHIGIDGQELESGKALAFFQDGWTWSNTLLFTQARATVEVTTTGLHTINLWMREDGFIADRIVVTKSATYQPFATGASTTPAP